MFISWYFHLTDREPSLLPICLFIYISVDMDSHFTQWIFAMFYNFYLFCCSNCCRVVYMGPVKLTLVWFYHVAILLRAPLYFLAQVEVPGQSCIYPVPSQTWSQSQGTLVSFSREWIWKSRSEHSRAWVPFQGPELGKIQMYVCTYCLYICTTHTYTQVCILKHITHTLSHTFTFTYPSVL